MTPDLEAGRPVVLYLQQPKEKVWGILLSVRTPGVVVRGLDLAAFDEWMRQEARDEERQLGLVTAFYPMHRIDRVEVDETVGTVLSCSERFARDVGRTVWQVLELAEPSG
jgi:hypothetical protein